MSLVVATEPTSLVAVEDQCARIEAWAETCANVAELRDAMNKCSAISEYLRLTATEGTARVETTKRRLEVRVGVLLEKGQCVAAAAVDTINSGRGGKKLPSWWKADA